MLFQPSSTAFVLNRAIFKYFFAYSQVESTLSLRAQAQVLSWVHKCFTPPLGVDTLHRPGPGPSLAPRDALAMRLDSGASCSPSLRAIECHGLACGRRPPRESWLFSAARVCRWCRRAVCLVRQGEGSRARARGAFAYARCVCATCTWGRGADVQSAVTRSARRC